MTVDITKVEICGDSRLVSSLKENLDFPKALDLFFNARFSYGICDVKVSKAYLKTCCGERMIKMEPARYSITIKGVKKYLGSGPLDILFSNPALYCTSCGDFTHPDICL